MLIVFGPIAIELTLQSGTAPDANRTSFVPGYRFEPGGRAANQALAACRAGAKTALVGMVGDDELGSFILSQLRREGITTSGVAKSKRPTGCVIHQNGEDQHTHHTIALAANEDANAEQIPDEVLHEDSVVLVQTEIPINRNIEVLEKAKADGATTVMNLSPSLDLSQKILNNLDYLIVNRAEALRLAQKLGLEAGDNTIKIAQALSHAGKMGCIITMGAQGSIGVCKDGKSWKVGTPNIDAITDNTGAEDVYAGTFAACIDAGLPMHQAIKHASIAATLTCTKEGGQSSYPYFADIEEKLGELGDAEELELEIFQDE